MLNIALPKGRLGDKVYGLFSSIGYDCAAIYEDNRKLVFENPERGVRYLLVKPSDVAIYVEHGAADIGVVGKDVLLETQPDVYELLDLQLGRCRLCPEGIWAQTAQLPFAARGGRMSALEQEGKKEVLVTCLDDLVGEAPLTYIKMDVEGVEKEALDGGARVIRRCRPKMLLAGYHHDDDLWEIPLEVWNLVPEYRIYLRRHPYVPCWEINFFATV